MARLHFGPPSLLALVLLAASSPSAAQDDDDILVLDEEETAATAGPKKKLGVATFVPVGQAERALAEQVTVGVRSELKAGPFILKTLPLGGGQKGAAPVDVDAGKADLERGTKRAAQGRALLDKLNFRKATRAYERALSSFAKAAPALTDLEPVIEAWLGRAEIAARQGEEEATEAALAEVARLDPERELDPSRFPPLFIRTHAKVREAVLKEEPGAIVIDRTAVGAEVRLDGRAVGTAPLRIRNVPPGRHYVRVFREGQGLYGAVVEVSSGVEESLRPGFSATGAEGPLDLLANNRFTEDAADQVAAKAREAGVDIAVLGVVGRTELAVPTVLLAVDPASGQVARIGPLEFDGDLLNLSIEGLKAREALEKLAWGQGFGAVSSSPLVPGVQAASAVEMAEVRLRFDIKAPAEARRGPRVVGAAEPREDSQGRRRLGGGSSSSGGGRSKSLRDDEDPYLVERRPVRRKELVEEDKPLLEQPWFWPVALGGGVAGAAVLAGGAALGLLATGVLPDPRPNAGVQVEVVVP